MSLEKQPSITLPPLAPNGRSFSPNSNGMRQRTPHRTSTLSEVPSPRLSRRRSSFFSETLSDTHRSLRSSTDDLLLPRVGVNTHLEDSLEPSNWHSVPLVLALLPAVGGLFFTDGSAIVTDVTLLGLAAIFLNWALRLPWELYHSAQATVLADADSLSPFSPIEEEDEDPAATDSTTSGTRPDVSSTDPVKEQPSSSSGRISKASAEKELRFHEVSALLACFVFPVLGAWLLHGIRSQLSRPSEGLVSNYNLTIFLLVAELRPLSHLMKLVQRRTLFLQRRVNSSTLQAQRKDEALKVDDLTGRLEELEAHIAETATTSTSQSMDLSNSDGLVAKLSSQASSDLRKVMQPELDALNRAMRRYEKRMTISAIQVEARLQDLETRLKDVVVLAAAAQRNADKQPRNYILILTNWLCATVVVPVQFLARVLSLPGRLARALLDWLTGLLKLSPRVREVNDLKSSQRQPSLRPRTSQKRSKGTV